MEQWMLHYRKEAFVLVSTWVTWVSCVLCDVFIDGHLLSTPSDASKGSIYCLETQLCYPDLFFNVMFLISITGVFVNLWFMGFGGVPHGQKYLLVFFSFAYLIFNFLVVFLMYVCAPDVWLLLLEPKRWH